MWDVVTDRFYTEMLLGQKSPVPIVQDRFLEDSHTDQYSNSIQVLQYETKNL
jgi:hypothetical protein